MPNLDQFIEAAKIILITYFLLLAVLAVFNKHYMIMTYPIKVIYSTTRLLIIALTFGKIRITPIAKNAKRQSARKVRKIKNKREDKKAREEPKQQMVWGKSQTQQQSQAFNPFEIIEEEEEDERPTFF